MSPPARDGGVVEGLRRRVFCVGFHRTGTKSLATALGILGYRVAGPFGMRDPDIAGTALPRALEIAREHDAFQDNPWAVLYRELDLRFPGSRFVLTVRESDRWIDSVVRGFGADSTPMREWIYGAGSPLGNEAAYVRRFERHEREVREHFAARDDLLVMDLEAGDGWEALCPFLGHEPPAAPFPHVNRDAGKLDERQRRHALDRSPNRAARRSCR